MCKSKRGSIRSIFTKYGLTLAQYELILKSQNGFCDLCGESLGSEIGLDHNHKTGQNRGFLHKGCNTKLAAIEDENFREKALVYLEKWNARR